jgi:hypothetical protein
MSVSMMPGRTRIDADALGRHLRARPSVKVSIAPLLAA